MTGIVIPASCPNCGGFFASRAFSISGNIQRMVLSGNRETCPFCGGMANIVDGIFNVANDVLSVVSAPNVTKQMLASFEEAIQFAYAHKSSPAQLASEVEKIDPSFAEVVRNTGASNNLYLGVLMIILMAIKSCSLEIKIDANQLIEQMTNKDPSIFVSKTPNKK